jgi:hypothetical protein
MSAQADLFAPPKPKAKRIPKRELRAIKRTWREQVERWARGVLSYYLVLEYADPADEATYINVDGSGPPPNWRKRILEGLIGDLYDIGQSRVFLDDAGDATLLKTAIRVGRLPRSIIATMPPKPEALREAAP